MQRDEPNKREEERGERARHVAFAGLPLPGDRHAAATIADLSWLRALPGETADSGATQ